MVLLSMDQTVIGKRLASARRIRGLTRLQAAEALGVTQTSIAELEDGGRRPGPRELYALSRLYGRQLGDLLRPTRDDVNPDLFAQCLAAREQATSIAECEQNIQYCEDFSYWYTELEEMVGSSIDDGASTTLRERFEGLAARAFAQALISEGQLARILTTDRTSAVRIARERLQEHAMPEEDD